MDESAQNVERQQLRKRLRTLVDHYSIGISAIEAILDGKEYTTTATIQSTELCADILGATKLFRNSLIRELETLDREIFVTYNA